MRINRYVASASGLSRRAADTAVEADRVKINQRVATPGDQAEAGDIVTLDGTVISLPQSQIHIMLNKPVGYVCSRKTQGTDPTIYELLPEKFHSLKPAGRLDRDSSGLVILSNDGNFIQLLTHPSADKTKAYELELSKPLSDSDIRRLEEGVKLEDGPSYVTLTKVKSNLVHLTLGEGRNRQLRRTFGALGYAVVKLHRSRIADYRLSGLQSGAWRQFGQQGSGA